MSRRCKHLLGFAVAITVALRGAPAQSLKVRTDSEGRQLLEFIAPLPPELHRDDAGWSISMRGQAGVAGALLPETPAFVMALEGVSGKSFDPSILSIQSESLTQRVDIASAALVSDLATNASVHVMEAWQGSRKLLRIEVRPVLYDPATETIRWCRQLTAELREIPSRDIEGPRGPIRPREADEAGKRGASK